MDGRRSSGRIRLARGAAGFFAVALLALSLALAVRRTPESGGRGFASIIQLVQRGILAGDQALSDTQVRFNAVFVAVFLEGLSPAQRQTLATATSTVGGALADLLSLAGLATLAVLVPGYLGVAYLFDKRFPTARDRGEAPPSGE